MFMYLGQIIKDFTRTWIVLIIESLFDTIME